MKVKNYRWISMHACMYIHVYSIMRALRALHVHMFWPDHLNLACSGPENWTVERHGNEGKE